MGQRNKTASAENRGETRPKTRRRLRRFLRVTTILGIVMIGVYILTGTLYHGPQTMSDVVTVMPGVPIFPLSEMASSNERVQRAMTLPLMLIRLQGAKRVEIAQLVAPADDFFILDWYHHIAPTQGWKYIGQERMGASTRMLFLRQQDGLQITVGKSRDIFTTVQLIYLSGLTHKQQVQLSKAVDNTTPPQVTASKRTPPTPKTVATPPTQPENSPKVATDHPNPQVPKTTVSPQQPAPDISHAPKPPTPAVVRQQPRRSAVRQLHPKVTTHPPARVTPRKPKRVPPAPPISPPQQPGYTKSPVIKVKPMTPHGNSPTPPDASPDGQ